MGKSAVALGIVVFLLAFASAQESVPAPTPLPPQTGAEEPAPALPAAAPVEPEPEYPTRVIIPNIKLDSPIQNMGLDSEGRMDVPSEKTRNVGWYEDGTVPGEVGSAVFDAHVTAVFKNLKRLEVGDHIYVITDEGTELDFVIEEVAQYLLEEVPADRLFNGQDGRRLNLITCAGKRISGNEFTHRLVVYAKLAE